MGLDMYLTRRVYVGENERKELKIEGVPGVDVTKVSHIVEDVMYWRKSNAIHKWFVDNCQGGNDDCREGYVGMENLERLLKIVTEVLKDKSLAPTLLPSEDGFFFGGTEYDEWYFNDLKETKKELTKVIKENKSGDLYYRSSW